VTSEPDPIVGALLARWHAIANSLAGVIAFGHLIRDDAALPEHLRRDAGLLVTEAEAVHANLAEVVEAARERASAAELIARGDEAGGEV
jgi:hypothetical protein